MKFPSSTALATIGNNRKTGLDRTAMVEPFSLSREYNKNMSEENRETLAVYDKAAQIYLDGKSARDNERPDRAREKREQLAKKMREAFGALPAGAKLLEIGSADGENAKILESFGYNVTASDVAPAFIAACEKQGLKTVKFNVLTDDFLDNYNGIFCWRVFAHFTREDIAMALTRIYDALLPGGRFMFNVFDRATHDCDSEMKDFSGNYEMGAKRYFAYYRKEEIMNMIMKTSFKLVKEWHEHGGHNDWHCFVLEK